MSSTIENIENLLTIFEISLKEKQNFLLKKYQHTNLTNLTPLHTEALKLLKQRNVIVIKPTDKNLSLAAMDKKAISKKNLTEHLLSKDYTKLTKQEALSKKDSLHNLLKNLITSAQDQS